MMHATKQPTSRKRISGSITLITLSACLLLFAIDKDTHSLSDLLKPGNLAALLLYFIPTYTISSLLHRVFARKYREGKSLLLGMLIGVPLSFILIITLFLLLRH
jgi:hypothetical protein